ncbi:hypothetical protein RJ640_021538 [Escallonia rubra]|uniref:Uncharacterized protein n=1 Tax=Escallonia rubra TaxID=112253 RepID=A0AA88QRW8_9ASTE|nr:hypothetical protein RJ640_021538 [Escallonia rubra]
MEGRERSTREKRLYDASLSGNVETLNELMREDELTLARVSLTCFNETPLHVAAMLGHANFAKALVSYKPDLASQLDSQGCSALHLAASNGFVEIVKTLLRVDSDVCFVRDEDRRTPLHLAVMKGQVKVVKELARARWEASRLTLDRDNQVPVQQNWGKGECSEWKRFDSSGYHRTHAKRLENHGNSSIARLMPELSEPETYLLHYHAKQIKTITRMMTTQQQ